MSNVIEGEWKGLEENYKEEIKSIEDAIKKGAKTGYCGISTGKVDLKTDLKIWKFKLKLIKNREGLPENFDY